MVVRKIYHCSYLIDDFIKNIPNQLYREKFQNKLKDRKPHGFQNIAKNRNK